MINSSRWDDDNRLLSTPKSARPAIRVTPDLFGRISERVATFMGTAGFVLAMTIFIAIWLGWNVIAPPNYRFDPYTFTFLTLILSLQASYAAPLILLAQYRQTERDLMQASQDRRQAELALTNSEFLARELADLRLRTGSIEKQLDQRESLKLLHALSEQVSQLQTSIERLS